MANLSKILCVLLMLSIVQSAAANALSSVEIMNGFAMRGKDELTRYQELQAAHSKIAAAKSVEEARQLALMPTNDAIKALHNARTLMPLSDDIRTAEQRLNEMRLQIKTAVNQQQVADKFSGIMLAGLDNDRAVRLGVGKVGCDYSSGETIAIVLGLILGIIPGLILMVVLC